MIYSGETGMHKCKTEKFRTLWDSISQSIRLLGKHKRLNSLPVKFLPRPQQLPCQHSGYSLDRKSIGSGKESHKVLNSSFSYLCTPVSPKCIILHLAFLSGCYHLLTPSKCYVFRSVLGPAKAKHSGPLIIS